MAVILKPGIQWDVEQKFRCGTVSTYIVSYVKLIAKSSTTKAQCTGLVHAIIDYKPQIFMTFFTPLCLHSGTQTHFRDIPLVVFNSAKSKLGSS
jgi:hypothetical protein